MRIMFLLQLAVLGLGLASSSIAADITENPAYRETNDALREKGLCRACASNIAEAYVKYPESKLARTVEAALAGDNNAYTDLTRLPSTIPLPAQTDQESPQFIKLLLSSMTFLAIIAFMCALLSKSFRERLIHQKLVQTIIQNKSIIAGIVVAAFLISSIGDNEKQTPQQKACRDNWRQCSDNQQLIDTGSHLGNMRGACERAAREKAKYGEPEFPWLSFSQYRKGKDYVETGMVYLVERGAKFQNMYGTTVKAEVACTYDI